MSNDLVVREREQRQTSFFSPTTLGELIQFAECLSRSQVVPKAYQGRPDDIVAAVQMGAEDGLAPMAALRNIAVINGKPAYYGDAVPGIAMVKGYILDVEDRFEGEGDQRASVVTVTKRNGERLTRRFSVADAKKAGLIGKGGPWTQYQDRMLFMRARSWAVRDGAPHAQFGPAVEELQHIGPDYARDVTPHDPQTGEVRDGPRDPMESYDEAPPKQEPATVKVRVQLGPENFVEASPEEAFEALKAKLMKNLHRREMLDSLVQKNRAALAAMSEDNEKEITRIYDDAVNRLEETLV